MGTPRLNGFHLRMSALKGLLERALLRSGIAAAASRRLGSDAALVLAYHNVVAAGDTPTGDLSLHLPRQSFAEQLDVLARECDVVSLAQLFDDPVSRPSGRRRVAITFDDAYHGALAVALPEVTRRGMPATIFVAPGLLGATTWWDVLAAQGGGVVPHELRERALWELGGRGPDVIERLGSRVERAQPERTPLPRIATIEELAPAAANPLVTLAAHTWSHVNLAAVPPDELERELALPRDWLNTRFPTSLPMLSYPYGLSAPPVETAVGHAGYEVAFRVEGGWLRAGSGAGSFAIPRLNVPARLSLDGFRLRLAGIKAG